MALIYTRIYAQPVEFNRALGYAYDALVKGPYPFDAMSTWKGLSERVAQGIYMGQGLLLPHTRVSGLQEPLMAFVVAREGITGIKTRNDEKAQFMCVLLSPAENAAMFGIWYAVDLLKWHGKKGKIRRISKKRKQIEHAA